MSAIPRFVEYAASFEKAVASDDWSVVAPFFTEDAEYEVGIASPFTADGNSLIEGREAILAHFEWISDAFDRRFAALGLGG